MQIIKAVLGAIPISLLSLACTLIPSAERIQLDDDDIGGVVTGRSGPEAGVWVIAETDAFDSFFARIVVTDEASLPGSS